jgi:hypothetical protein
MYHRKFTDSLSQTFSATKSPFKKEGLLVVSPWKKLSLLAISNELCFEGVA